MADRRSRWMWPALVVPALAACGLTDGATRIALNKVAGDALTIDLERRNGRPMVVDVR